MTAVLHVLTGDNMIPADPTRVGNPGRHSYTCGCGDCRVTSRAPRTCRCAHGPLTEAAVQPGHCVRCGHAVDSGSLLLARAA